MLYGKLLRSPYPHAFIKRIDYRRALEMEEVVAVVTSQDFPSLARSWVIVAGETRYEYP